MERPALIRGLWVFWLLLVLPLFVRAQNYQARVQVYAAQADSTFELSQLNAIEFSLLPDSSLTVYLRGGKTNRIRMLDIDSLIFSPDTANSTLTFLFTNGTDSTYFVAGVDSIVIPPIVTTGLVSMPHAPERLLACYPNPSSGSIRIMLTLKKPERVYLVLSDVAGKLVRDFGKTFYLAGTHTVTWDGLDTQGTHLPNGIFFLHLESSEGSETLKLTLTR